MNASDKINQIAKIRRSQDTKERIAHGYGLGEDVKANKLQYCGSWLYLREFLNTGESKVINALLCKLSHLCEVCAVRRQAKQFAATVPKVQSVMSENPDLFPILITRTIKSGPDLQRQADHFRTSRAKMLAAIRRTKSSKTRNAREWEMAKVLGQVRSFEVKRAKNHPDHWHFHEHIFALVSEYLDQEKLASEWLDVTGDSFIVDVRKVHAKNEDSDPIVSGLLEVIKYSLKFAGLSAADAWHAHEILSGSRMTECLGLLRGILVGALESDFPLEDESGPWRDFIARWIESKNGFALETVEDFGASLTADCSYNKRAKIANAPAAAVEHLRDTA